MALHFPSSLMTLGRSRGGRASAVLGILAGLATLARRRQQGVATRSASRRSDGSTGLEGSVPVSSQGTPQSGAAAGTMTQSAMDQQNLEERLSGA
jgi:hypothetical protein